MKLAYVKYGMAMMLAFVVVPAGADEQQIARGKGLQSAVVVNAGANGICETTAATGDIQAATVGQGSPFQTDTAPDPDDAANPENNSNHLDLEVVDNNDL